MEEALATLSGVKKLRSRSTADGAEINMEFDWGKNLDIVRMQVGEKMDQVKPTLPAGVGQVLIFSFSTSDIPVIEGRIAAEGVDLSQNFELLEARVANRIRRVQGVARVGLHGVARGRSPSTRPDKVKAPTWTWRLIARLRERRRTGARPGGCGGLRTARALGAFGSIEAIETAGDERGLRLSRHAEIRYESRRRHGRHLDGDYAVAIDVKDPPANTVEVARRCAR